MNPTLKAIALELKEWEGSMDRSVIEPFVGSLLVKLLQLGVIHPTEEREFRRKFEL